MLYAAYRLSMPLQQYLDGHTEQQHRVWLAWFGMHQWEGPRYIPEDESIEFDWEKECPHWGDKVAAAKFQMTAKDDGTKKTAEDIERAIAARFRMAKITVGEKNDAVDH